MKFSFKQNNNWESELDDFVVKMRNVSSKTIDKISKKEIHKHKARLYWMLSENNKIVDIINNLTNITSDFDSTNFI